LRDQIAALDKTTVLNALENAKRTITLLRKVQPFASEHVRWILDTRSILAEVFGQASTIYLSFYGLVWQFQGTLLATALTWEYEKAEKDQQVYRSSLGIAEGILDAAIDQINRKGAENVYEGKDTPKESSEIIKIISLIDNKLRKAVRKEPKDETEIKDALENLFIGADMDREFTREKENVVYSSKTYIPDFTFKRISTTVEAKLCDSPAREKAIIAEINDDILAYKTKYANLIFVVYDLGSIRDQQSFSGSMEQAHEHVIVRVVKH
jgi:hypothetical protein